MKLFEAKRKLPIFAKRHYERLAQVVQGLVLSHDELSEVELDELAYTRHDIADAFANMLEKDNPRFDRRRFVQACVPGNNVKARKVVNGELPVNVWRAR
jgi:hypothetical protein